MAKEVINHMESAVISVKEACEILGVRPARLRYLMRTNTIDVGRVVEPSTANGNYGYLIYRDKLMAEIGRIDKGEYKRDEANI